MNIIGLSSSRKKKISYDKNVVDSKLELIESKRNKRISKGKTNLEPPENMPVYERVLDIKIDPIVRDFCSSCSGNMMEYRNFKHERNVSADTIVVARNMVHYPAIQTCIEHNTKYIYIDTGYIGNHVYEDNPNGKKLFHRIVYNEFQLTKFKKRPDDRLKSVGLDKPKEWKRDGKKILICAPSAESMKVYGWDVNEWLKSTQLEIEKYTNRPIEIRHKKNRSERISNDPIEKHLMDDVFAMVTYGSISACESVYFGIPAFTFTECAASPVTLNDISQIENPYYPERYEWLCSLSYGQFTKEDIKDRTAWRIIQESFV